VTWHEVRIRDDHPPHAIPNPEMWEHDRGLTLRIGQMIDRETALKLTALASMPGCKCEQFFMVHPDDVDKFYHGRFMQKPCWICRGFLEMD
jgi:hypothetical protein